MEITMLAIDLAKDTFQLYGIQKNGKPVIDRSIKRSKLLLFTANMLKTTIVMEACGGSNYWFRKFSDQGHEVKMISPQHVKPFVGTQKNDRNDAKGISEAAQRPNMKFVPPKNVAQQDVQTIHRIRERLVKEKTSLINQIRGILLENGITIAKTVAKFQKAIPEILENGENELSDLMRELLYELYEEFNHVRSRVEKYTARIKSFSKQNEVCQRLEELSGVGPIISTAFWMAVGNPDSFKNGRQVSAWIGLVPRQHSSGGKQKLSGITKQGDEYLRRLLIHGGRSQISAAQRRIHKSEQDLKLLELVNKKGINRACVARANRLGRHMWAIMAS